MPLPSGAIAWNELLTSDAEAALKFYSGLFGWELMTRINMGPKGAYLIFGAEGVQMGGMMTAPIPGGPLWLPYTEVDSADAVVVSAVKAGATLCLGPQTVPGGGRIANFLDPQGVMFAVHSMTVASATPAAPKPAAKRSGASRPAAKKSAVVTRKRKSAKRSVAVQVTKKKRGKPAARKPARSPSKRKAATAHRNKRAKRAVAKKRTKKSARAKSSRRPARRAKHR
jgi:predicted enzyme related to lactoylglutathione lyase